MSYLQNLKLLKNANAEIIKGVYIFNEKEFPDLINMGVPLGLYLKRKPQTANLHENKQKGGNGGFEMNNVIDTTIMETFFNDFGKIKKSKNIIKKTKRKAIKNR